ncbi:AAA family ATPase [Flavobacterium psychrophilum]|uniref:AAA family ATPase n=1 Tax=Flavobacterium psychrophilum TaxID=96345 RepID=UPI000B7C25A0|nr:AAA family ATPase [Flavobacterium psychrophilum]MBF2090928.1 AAA family ATPase [Flavobacterium psychrophilum]MCB6230833.1 KTI12 family protein [Flavobacterium psychrophilum]MEB3380743.1 AAA family ATPase [Flavobacterium psychrophilum]QZK99922.1 AAA family ATPase [Flavobacterium psychrophilum]SNA87639.1 conserved hypothetical protein [Flavobacterium psychrophilum]
MAEQKLDRAYTYADIEKRKFQLLDFDGKWLDHIGKPERSESWIIYGLSGQGKTSYAMQLAKYLTQFERVHYNTLEEGTKQSFKLAMERVNMKSVGNKFTYKKESYEKLVERLSKKRMPKIIIIDSLQYFFNDRKKTATQDYFSLIEKFPTTLFIFVSHATGKVPRDDLGVSVKYHSDVKIHVHGFVAHSSGEYAGTRYGGGEALIISEEKYRENQVVLYQQG